MEPSLESSKEAVGSKFHHESG